VSSEAVAEAEARAARNGLRLEFDDRDAGPSWPGKRYASAHLFDGQRQMAGVAHSYGDEASRQRALSFCAKWVFYAPTG
jgi:hypothetical protein